MRLTLKYEGLLYGTRRQLNPSQTNRRAEHKQHIRQTLHPQLKRFWSNNSFLSNYRVFYEGWIANAKPPTPEGHWGVPDDKKGTLSEITAERVVFNGNHYVPLVWGELSLRCHLNIVLLRPQLSASVLSLGDIDNQTKTLLDCLSVPKHSNEIPENEKGRRPLRDPMYCLLEDDSLVRGLNVRVEQLLDIPLALSHAEIANYSLAIISCEVFPESITHVNMSYYSA